MRDFLTEGLKRPEIAQLLKEVCGNFAQANISLGAELAEVEDALRPAFKQARQEGAVAVQMGIWRDDWVSHSVALFIDERTDTVRYADSLGKAAPAAVRELAEDLGYMFVDAQNKQQWRGWFCGLWTAVNLQAWLKGRDLPAFSSQEEAEEVIAKFAAAYIAN